MTTAKVFRSGRSQAIRLPKGFRVKASEVFLKKVPEGFLVVERDPWEICREACQEISDELRIGGSPKKICASENVFTHKSSAVCAGVFWSLRSQDRSTRELFRKRS